MTRKRKSRKGGPIGAAKPALKSQEELAALQKRDRKRKGLAAGSRNSEVAKKIEQGKNAGPADKRVGSKKPIALGANVPKSDSGMRRDLQPAVQLKKQVHEKPGMSDEERLLAIENDERLNSILDMLDDDMKLNAQDQAYFNKMTAKHAKLLEKVEGKQKSNDEDDLDDHFDKLDW